MAVRFPARPYPSEFHRDYLVVQHCHQPAHWPDEPLILAPPVHALRPGNGADLVGQTFRQHLRRAALQGGADDAVAGGPPGVGRGAQGEGLAAAGPADHNVDTWEQFLITVGARTNREVPIQLIRKGVPLTLTVTPEATPHSRFDIGDIGVLPDVHPHVPNLKAGAEAIQQGKAATIQTPREAEYLAAIEVFYTDYDKIDHKTRAERYEHALKHIIP